MSRPNVILTMDQLKETALYWAGRMGLGGWEIFIDLERGFNMDGNAGRVVWTLSKRLANIEVLLESDFPDTTIYIDMEEIIVHELCHVMLGAWDDYSRTSDNDMSDLLVDVCIEQPIEAISKLMVELRRLAEHKFSWEEKVQDGDGIPIQNQAI